MMGVSYDIPSKDYIDKKLKSAFKSGMIPRTINMPINSFEGRSNFVVFQWEDRIPKKELIKRRKTEDRSHVHKGLFQKVYKEDGFPLVHTSQSKKKVNGVIVTRTYTNYVYKMINAWGDSFKAQEFYNTAQASILDNDFDKVKKQTDEFGYQTASDEMDNATIEGIFNGDVQVDTYNDWYLEKVNRDIPTNRINADVLKALGYSSAEAQQELAKMNKNNPTDYREEGFDLAPGELLEDYSQSTGRTMGESTPIKGLNERLYGMGLMTLSKSEDFYENLGAVLSRGRIKNQLISMVVSATDNRAIIGDQNYSEIVTPTDNAKLKALKPKIDRYKDINNYIIVRGETRTVAIEKEYVTLSNDIMKTYYNIMNPYVQKILGKSLILKAEQKTDNWQEEDNNDTCPPF